MRWAANSQVRPSLRLAPAVLADSREPELIIASASDGLLAFNGRTFRQILPANADARAITSILPAPSGHLLIGTKKRGVLVYDGKQITVLHPSLDALYVTALAGNESDLWVGTLNHGVLHFHAGETDSFTEAQGLPDPQVLSLAISGETTYVGTATGVAVFSAGHFSRVLAPGVLATALLATPTQLYVGSEDQGVIVIPLEGRHPNPNLGSGAPLAEVRQLFTSGDAVFAVARNGLYRLSAHAFGWQRVLEAGGNGTDRPQYFSAGRGCLWPAVGRLLRSRSRSSCLRQQPSQACGRRARILRQPHFPRLEEPGRSTWPPPTVWFASTNPALSSRS